MAFKTSTASTGLDFSKLRSMPPKTAEEREAEYQAERAQERAADQAKREEFAKKDLVMTVSEVSSRFTPAGDRVFRIYGADSQARKVTAEYFLPACYDHAHADAIFERLPQGSTHRLMGYWKAEIYNGSKHFIFKAQMIDDAMVL